eukprot:1294036-Pleurochrysis_carterae.AAC.1
MECLCLPSPHWAAACLTPFRPLSRRDSRHPTGGCKLGARARMYPKSPFVLHRPYSHITPYLHVSPTD